MPNMNLIEALNRELERNHMKHVQMLLKPYKGRYAVKFTCVDNDSVREKLMAIADRFCESMELVKAKKTTYIYAI